MVGIAYSSTNHLDSMLESMSHLSWHVKDKCKNVNAGIVRLPILDKFIYETDQFTVLVDGYIYNVSLEEIVHKYNSEGQIALQTLEGEFTLLFFDKIQNLVYVVNDPFGLRRCYYSINSGELLVSTETKAIWSVLEPSIDESTVYSMLRFRRVFSDKTLFVNVRRLMPGSIIRYEQQRKKIEITTYYKYTYTPKESDEVEIAKKAVLLFKNALDKRITGNKRTAFALSGGLDSRAMTTLAKDKKITAFTYGSGADPDSIIGQKIARKIGIKHELITFDCREQAIADLVEFASYLTEGLTTVAYCFQLYVFARLHRNVDEYFWTFELDDTLGGNLLGQVYDVTDYQRYSSIELMLRRSIFTVDECERLFNFQFDIRTLLEEHYSHVSRSDVMAEFESAQLLDLLQRGITGHFIARNFVEERIPTFDKELIAHIASIPLRLKREHYIYNIFLKYIDPDLAQVKSATTGLSVDSSRLEKFLVRNKARFEKIKQVYLKTDSQEKNYFDVDIAMRAKPWIKKYQDHVLNSQIVKKYINTEFAEELLIRHLQKKAENGTKLFAILTVALALNIFSNKFSEKPMCLLNNLGK
ncbi:asparagine synthetase B family protein [Candidatus Nitrosotenuis uzonensis]|uniref:Putative asparagine synthetase [glutamine-hydrolyzing] n=1 Tax=Candidatus Nitrosotenuis uzonensis TaxID=1407055 RepID=A0A812EUA7_9ARCH|nr:asparagine synthetase B family protein [Candidatus Nitrosotenuis uzonensis]CAE6488181.1 putative Asparagine synthase (glutamine-hydrolyzing) [Candidatus Nitrosotenuis uzonensis]